MWHCSAPSPLPSGAGEAALPARGTSSCGRSPVPLGAAGMEAGCCSAPFLAVLEVDVGKGVWRRGESRTRALGCVPRPTAGTSTEAGEQVSCADGKEQGSIREPEPSVPQPPGESSSQPSFSSHRTPGTQPGPRAARQTVSGLAPSHQVQGTRTSPCPCATRKPFQSATPAATTRRPCTDTITAKDPAPSALLMPGEAGKQDHGAEGLHGLGPPA